MSNIEKTPANPDNLVPPFSSVQLAAKTKKAAIEEAVERFGFESMVKAGRGDDWDFFLHGPRSAKLYVCTAADVRKGWAKKVGASLVFVS